MEDELNKKLKVLCIGDSLSLPGHGNQFEDTWYYKLQKHFSSFYFASYFKRATTTVVLVSEGGGDGKSPAGSDCLEFYLPDIIIIQLGIVDCSPRYLKRSKIVYKIVERLPLKLKRITYYFIKKLVNRSLKKADITPEQFQHHLKLYLNRCLENKVKKVVFIAICNPDENVKQKSPVLIQAVELYNKIITEISSQYNFTSVISPLNSGEIDLYDDGYHPNPKGNDLVYKALKEEINFV
jgi:acyl-CoA thioesterase I